MPGADFKWDGKAYAEFLNAKARVVGGQTKDTDSGITLLDKDSNWLFSHPHVRDSEHPTVLVQREWHDALWAYFKENMVDSDMRFAVVGTPGIGKSVGINIMVHRLLRDADKFSNWSDTQLMQDADVAEYARANNITTLSADDKRHLSAMKGRRYIVVIFPKHGFTYVFDTVCQLMSAAIEFDDCSPARIFRQIDPQRTSIVVLHDLGQKAPMEEAARYPCVLFTSPTNDTKQYEEFLKDAGGRGYNFYAPVYDHAEMRFVAKNVWSVSEKEWEERARVCGNVPRLVFGSAGARATWTTSTDAKITDLTSTGGFVLCKQVLTNVLVSGVSDSLIVIGPKVEVDGGITYLKPSTTERSDHVRTGILNCNSANMLAAAKDALQTGEGKFFERAAVQLIRGNTAYFKWGAVTALEKTSTSLHRSATEWATAVDAANTAWADAKGPSAKAKAKVAHEHAVAGQMAALHGASPTTALLGASLDAVGVQRAPAAAANKLEPVYFDAKQRPTLWLQPRCLYLPRDDSFPLVDAFMFAPPSTPGGAATIVAFQMTVADSLEAKHNPTEVAFTRFVGFFNQANLCTAYDAATDVYSKPAKFVLDSDAPARKLCVTIDGAFVPLSMSVVFCTRSETFQYQSMVGVRSEWTSAHFAWDQVRQYRLDVIRNV